MSNSEQRKIKVETPPKVSKSQRAQRRLIEARLRGDTLRVKATKLQRRQFLHLAAGAAVIPGMTRTASAQTYPSRPITLIVPFPAGGGTDVLARIMAERMRLSLAQSIVVENVSGANGTIGVGRAARATPDGYTIELGQWASHIIPGAMYALRYDVASDLEPIAAIGTFPLVLYAKKAMQASDLKELITWLKANPDKASQGTTTAGMHAFGGLFQRETGTRFQFAPYRGEAPAVQDLIAGQIDLMWNSSNNIAQVHAGGIKAYMVTAKTRLSIAPDIPTADEAGLPALTFSPWWALFAPRRTPAAIINTLNAAATEALADPAVRKRFGNIGLEIFPRDQQTPQALSALVSADIEKWWPIVKAANIKGE